MTFRPPTVRERILLHLLDQTRSAGAYEAPPSATQAGIARAAWFNVQHVPQYIRPLEAEGLVRVQTAHVREGRRRRKVYELTEQGHRQAVALRDQLKQETVLLRDDQGTRAETIRDAMERTRGKLSVLDILREFLHAGTVDLTAVVRPETKGTVRFLADAPAVEGFVGRRTELEAIVGSGEGAGVFVVRGVAGIGKSTLGAKICALLEGDHHVFWHRVRRWDTPHSLLWGLASFLAAAGQPALKATLEKGDLARAIQVLQGSLAGLPALLVLDDAHEGGDELVAFFRYLRQAVSAAPDTKLVVLTRRFLGFYDRRDVALEGLVREIDLGGLTSEDVASFLGPQEHGRIPRGVAGHPLFLRMLRSASDPEARYALRGFDDFVHETIDAELSDSQRRIMKIASLYEVPVGAESLLLDPSLSHRDVRALVERALLLPAGEGVEVHDSLRPFFQRAMTETERVQLGGMAADQLGARAAQAVEEGDASRALTYLFNALKVAPSNERTAKLAESLGDLRDRMGDFQGSATSYARAIEVVGGGPQAAHLYRKLASVRIVQGDLVRARADIDRGFGALGDAPNGERGWLYLARCRVGIRENNLEEALEDGKAALGLFQVAGDVEGQGTTLYQLAHIETGRPTGSVSEARRLLEQALVIGEKTQDSALLAIVHEVLAHLLLYRLGAMEEAEEHLRAVESAFEAAEVSYRRARFLTLRALLRVETGEFSRANADYREAIALASQMHLEAITAHARFGIASIATFEGRLPEAQGALDNLVQEFVRLGAEASAVDAACAAAECSILRGDTDGFRRRVEQLESACPAAGLEIRKAQVLIYEGMSRFLEGRHGAALASLEEALAESEKAPPREKWSPHFVYSQLLFAAGRKAEAKRHREAAVAVLEAFSRTAELRFLGQREALLSKVLGTAPIPLR